VKRWGEGAEERRDASGTPAQRGEVTGTGNVMASELRNETVRGNTQTIDCVIPPGCFGAPFRSALDDTDKGGRGVSQG